MPRRTAVDDANPYSAGSGNPYSSGSSAPGVPADPQMSQSQGADEADHADEQNNGTTAKLYSVGCLSCGETYEFGRVTAKMKCKCGSSELVYEASDADVLFPTITEGKSEVLPDEIEIKWSDGYWATVNHESFYDEDPNGWRYILLHGDKVIGTAHSATRQDAVEAVESLTALLQTGELRDNAFHRANRKTAGDNPFAKKDDDKKKKKDDDSKGGSSSDSAPKDPATPEATDGPPADPDALPVDPNAPVPGTAPGAPGDPLLQAMDTAQGQIDQTVEQTNQLGHDAKEVAYDVDELFSEWRCMNCDAEGRADISDDGQVQIGGDLFDSQDPCPVPAAPDPNDPAAQQAQQPAIPLPPGAPAAGQATPQAPPQQQQTASRRKTAVKQECYSCGHKGDDWKYVTGGAQCPECGSFEVHFSQTPPEQGEGFSETFHGSHRTADIVQDIQDNKHNINQRNIVDQQDGEDEDDSLAKEERLTMMVEGMLATNPGMGEPVAWRIAKATVERFPSLRR